MNEWWTAVPLFSVWNLFGIKINIRHKWQGILGLWGLGIIILLSLFDCGGGLWVSRLDHHIGTTRALMMHSLLDFLPSVISACPLGLLPLTLFASDETTAKIFYQTEQRFHNCPTAWQSWTKRSCGSLGYKFHYSDVQELEDICASTVLGRPYRKEQKNMLINYLNGVDGQGLTYVAQLWWMKSVRNTWLRRNNHICGD